MDALVLENSLLDQLEAMASSAIDTLTGKKEHVVYYGCQYTCSGSCVGSCGGGCAGTCGGYNN